MISRAVLVCTLLCALFAPTLAGPAMTMNTNPDQLPPGCTNINGNKHITVAAGKEFAHQHDGVMFTYNVSEIHVEPCTNLTVTLTNTDTVRHQFMVHGLPMETYPMGMVTLAVTGKDSVTGSFITPSTSGTHLVHCGVPEHEEKGMKTQLVVGDSSQTLPHIPGLTYQPPAQSSLWPATAIVAAAGLLLGSLLTFTAVCIRRTT